MIIKYQNNKNTKDYKNKNTKTTQKPNKTEHKGLPLQTKGKRRRRAMAG